MSCVLAEGYMCRVLAPLQKILRENQYLFFKKEMLHKVFTFFISRIEHFSIQVSKIHSESHMIPFFGFQLSVSRL